MSEPFIKETKKSSLVVKVLLGAVAVAALAALSVVALKFINYKESGGVPTDTSFAQVAISHPPQGVQLELSDPVKVEATAIGSKSFLSMELWINGELMGVQAAPSGGAYPFSTFFSWTPVEEGVYSLIAAAIDADGNKEISAQVTALVAQTEAEVEEVSADLNGSPSVLPAPSGGGYSPPDAPSPDESQGLTGIWMGSTGDWVTSLMAKVKPAAPELVVTAEKCGATLQIHDLSDNEEGFAVYRQVGISPMWVEIATLSSQSEFDWISYADDDIYGAVYYYVTAFNSQGESKSNFVLVSIDPTDCASDSEEIAVEKMELTLQIPSLKADKVYCYMSTNGMSWERWPLLGFLTPEEGENQITGPIMTLNYLGGEDQTEDEPSPRLNMNLFMECWGWKGGNLQKLGELATEGLNPQADSSIPILGEGMLAELKMETAVLQSQEAIYPIGPLANWGDLILEDPDQFDWQEITSDVLPRPYIDLIDNPSWCGGYLPPDAQNILGMLLYCFPYPAYDPDKGGTGPQPYLVWDFGLRVWSTYYQRACPAGYNEDCISYPELLSIAEETGGQVGFTITALQNGVKTVWNVTEPDLRMFVVPPMSCPDDVQYSVRLWYRPGKDGVAVAASSDDTINKIGNMGFSPAKILYSEESFGVTIPCANPPDPNWTFDNQAQYLDITFTSIELFGIDDGDEGIVIVEDHPEDLELYGYFRVKAPSMGYWETPNCFSPVGCEGDQPWSGPHLADQYRYLLVDEWESEGAFEVKEVKDNTNLYGGPGLIELGDVPLCQSTTKYSCNNEGQTTSFAIDNNTIRVYVTHLDALKLAVKLVDYDEASDDDVACVGTKLIPSRTLSEWNSTDGDYYIIHGESTDSGDCRVHITVKAVGDPVQIDTHWSD